jgi:hypothetical protein
MATYIEKDGKRIRIPTSVVRKGGDAIDGFLAEQEKANEILSRPPKAKKPKNKNPEEEVE